MHYLFHQAIEMARRVRMTDEEREEQLVSLVFGNTHLEYPEITREFVCEQMRKRRLTGAARVESVETV